MKILPRHFLALFSLFAACCSVANAQLTISANFTTGDTTDFNGSTALADSSLTSTQISQAENTIDQALAQITDNVTTNAPENLTINFLSDPNTGLGASVGTGTIGLDYSTYLADLEANPNKDANDVAALASLAANPVAPGTTIALGGANLLAIGDTANGNSLINGNGGLAGTVALNFNVLDTARSNPEPTTQYDLLSTVTHEVDEVLGIGGAGSTLAQGQSGQPAATDLGATDLFRYSAVGVRTHTIAATGPAYFSINGGVTNLVNFNQAPGGDFGDWGDGKLPPDSQGNTPAQVQDAFGGTANEASPDIGRNELTALDVVGYNLTPAGMVLDGLVPVPEPSTCAMMLLGLGVLVGFCVRRKTVWQVSEARRRLAF